MSDGESVRTLADIDRILGGLSLRDFTTVTSLSFSAVDGQYSKYSLSLIMIYGPRILRDELIFQCGGVSNLKIASFGGGLTQIMGLYVKDISDHGWSELNWEISDFENGVISFFAETLSMTLIKHNHA